MTIRGIVFDLDHTLFDRYATMRALGAEFYQTFREYISPTLTQQQAVDLWCEADRQRVHLDWPTVLAYAQQSGLFCEAPSLEDYRAFLLPAFCRVAVPYPFAKPTLTALRERGYKIGLITNGPSQLQRSKIALLTLEPYFDELMIPSELGMKKPDPQPFLEMAKRLTLPPSQLFYVGDNPINDVQGSRNAGYHPVWVKTTGVWVEGIQPAEFEIDTVEELLQLL